MACSLALHLVGQQAAVGPLAFLGTCAVRITVRALADGAPARWPFAARRAKL